MTKEDRQRARDVAEREAAAYMQASPPQVAKNFSLQKKIRNTRDYLIGMFVGMLIAVAAVLILKKILPESSYSYLAPIHNLIYKSAPPSPKTETTGPARPPQATPERKNTAVIQTAPSLQSLPSLPEPDQKAVMPSPPAAPLPSPLPLESFPGSYPEASARALSNADLAGRSGEELLAMANEIFARHGYIFPSSKQTKHFKQFAWYEELHENVDDRLSEIEQYNITRILGSVSAASPVMDVQIATENVSAASSAKTIPATEKILEPEMKAEPASLEKTPAPAASLEQETAPLPVPAETSEMKPAPAPATEIPAPPVQLVTEVPGKYPEASLKKLTPSDLAGMKREELRLMRNEIFARHGYLFQSDSMRKHFNAQPWYRGKRENIKGLLTAIEKNNIPLIKKMERQ